MIIHEEDGFILWTEEYGRAVYVHCEVDKNAKKHWQKRHEYMKMLPKKCYVIQNKDDLRLANFLQRMGAKQMSVRYHEGELAVYWRLK